MEEQLGFPLAGSGSIPTSSLHDMKIRECQFADISNIFREFHYKKDHIGGGILFSLSLVWNCTIVGGAVIGKLRHDKAYSTENKKCIEIRRMACLDIAPKNTESYFLSKIICS